MAEPRVALNFDRGKTTEVIIFMASIVSEPEISRIAKLIFFADKTHLESYGRTITDDSYVATYHGIIPFQTNEMLRNPVVDVNNPSFHIDGRMVVPDRVGNDDFLSQSDMTAIKRTIMIYQHYPLWQLKQFSQDYVWRQTWHGTDPHKVFPVSFVDIINSVDDEDGYLLEHFMNTYRVERNVHEEKEDY